MTSRQSGEFSLLELAAAVLLALSIVFTAWLSLAHPIGVDSGYYVMNSLAVGKGKLPYIDFHCMYTPAYFFLQSAWFSLFGASRTSIHVEIWAQLLALTALLAGACRVLAGISNGGLLILAAVFVPAMATIEVFYVGLEGMVNLFGWLGLLLALLLGRRLEAGEQRGAAPALLAAAAGFAAGLSVWTKQVGAPLTGLVLILPHVLAGRFVWRSALATLAGMLSAPVLFFAVYPQTFSPFLDMVVFGLFEYARLDDAYGANAWHWPSLRHYAWLSGLLAIGAAASFITCVAKRAGDSNRRELCCAALAAAAGLVLFVPFTSRPYPHYLQLCLPLAILSGAVLCNRLGRASSWARGALALWLLATAVLPVGRELKRLAGWRLGDVTPWVAQDLVADWVRKASAGSSEILILPDSFQYHALTGLPSPTGDYYYWPPEDQVVQAVARRVPVFIIPRTLDISVEPYPELLTKLGYRVFQVAEGVYTAWRPAFDPPWKKAGRPPPAPRSPKDSLDRILQPHPLPKTGVWNE